MAAAQLTAAESSWSSSFVRAPQTMLLNSSTNDEGVTVDDVTAMVTLTLSERFQCARHVLSKHFYILALNRNNTFME